MLEEARVPDIKPAEGVPLTKARLKAAFVKDEPLIIEDIAEFQQNKGRVNWIAQTTHPMLATSSSIYSGMPEIEGTSDVGRDLLAWMAARKKRWADYTSREPGRATDPCGLRLGWHALCL